jgi:hypothetical protein
MFKKFVKLVAPALVFAAAGVAQAEHPEWVRIEGYTYAGSGCPAGSVSDNLATDGKALTLLFDSFVASVGPGIPFSEKRKNCAVTVKLRFPQGWSYSIYTVDYRGYIDLQRGATGTQSARYWFSGDGRTGSAATNFYGPRTGDYTIRDRMFFNQTIWSPCGAMRDLVINSAVQVDNRNAPGNSGMLTEDAQDHSVQQIYGIQWQRCR